MSKYKVQAGTLFEDFETLEDWTASSQGLVSLSNTYTKTGLSSLKCQNNGAGVSSSATFTKTINADFSRVQTFSMWVFIENDPDTSGIHLIFSSTTDFSKKFDISIASPVREGWNYLVMARADFANTGSESWDNTMIRLRVQVGGTDADTVGTAYFDSLYLNEYSRPKCVIIFDDFPSTAYTLAYPYMRKYGFKGVHAAVSAYVGTEGKMTLAQIQETHGYGWDVVNHTNTHSALALDYGTDIDGMKTEISTCNDFLVANGFTRYNEHKYFVFPSSSWNATCLQALSDLGFIQGRSQFSRTQPNVSDNPFLMCGRSNDSGTSAATIKAKIDTAIGAGGTCVLYFHILRTPEDIATSLDPAIFYEVIDYLASKREQIDVVTWTEWYRGLTEARKLVQPMLST